MAPALPFWQIGSDGGFLSEPVELGRLLLAPAERADMIVDFTRMPQDAELYLINEGPDGAYRGDSRATPADPATTGQVMKFLVRESVEPDLSEPPDRLALPAPGPLAPATKTRKVALLEQTSATIAGVPPTAALLGTVDGGVRARMWSDPITETPAAGSTEVWEIHNRTVDAHPIHIHEAQFEVVDRQPFTGASRSPERWETGFKDTVIAYPHEITRIRATFDRAGLFVWHCHLLEHEDNEMMRPYRVTG